MERQIKLVGAAQIFFSVVRLLGSLALFLLFGSAGTTGSPLGKALFFLGLAVSLPALISGVGLLLLRPWARLVTVAVAAVELIMFPFGTFLGLITLWLMAKKEVASRLGRQAVKELSVDDLLAQMPKPDDPGDAH